MRSRLPKEYDEIRRFRKAKLHALQKVRRERFKKLTLPRNQECEVQFVPVEELE